MKTEIFCIIYTILSYVVGFCFGYITGSFKEKQNHKNYYDKGYTDEMKAEAFHRDLCEEEREK